jgi:D-alanyl-D-alanine dipeptidase
MRTIAASFICLLFAASAFAQIKSPTPSPVKIPFPESLQAVVVSAKKWDSTTGTAALFERANAKAGWKRVGDKFPVLLGRSGMAWAQDSAPERASEFKKEGDGRSPAGLFPITFAFGTSSKPEQLALPYIMVVRDTECVDDPRSGHYNKLVERMKVGNFDWKSSEKMLETPEEYGLGAFVAYNTYPVIAGNGSCIFLHVWKDAATPTSGCTAMERRNIERVVSWLDNSKTPYLVQLPESELKRYRKAWNLPKL